MTNGDKWCVRICVCKRERERERERVMESVWSATYDDDIYIRNYKTLSFSLSPPLSLFLYIYIYIHKRNYIYIYIYIYIIKYIYIYISKSKDRYRSRGWPEGSLFDSYYTKVEERVLHLFLDFSTLPLILTLC